MLYKGQTFECSKCHPEKDYADYHTLNQDELSNCDCICHSPELQNPMKENPFDTSLRKVYENAVEETQEIAQQDLGYFSDPLMLLCNELNRTDSTPNAYISSFMRQRIENFIKQELETARKDEREKIKEYLAELRGDFKQELIDLFGDVDLKKFNEIFSKYYKLNNIE